MNLDPKKTKYLAARTKRSQAFFVFQQIFVDKRVFKKKERKRKNGQLNIYIYFFCTVVECFFCERFSYNIFFLYMPYVTREKLVICICMIIFLSIPLSIVQSIFLYSNLYKCIYYVVHLSIYLYLIAVFSYLCTYG